MLAWQFRCKPVAASGQRHPRARHPWAKPSEWRPPTAPLMGPPNNDHLAAHTHILRGTLNQIKGGDKPEGRGWSFPRRRATRNARQQRWQQCLWRNARPLISDAVSAGLVNAQGAGALWQRGGAFSLFRPARTKLEGEEEREGVDCSEPALAPPRPPMKTSGARRSRTGRCRPGKPASRRPGEGPGRVRWRGALSRSFDGSLM